jgi:NADP-dependent 3-hydroxy acid dehydrogenase YdfG
MSSKVIFITGATSGIGFDAARTLTEQGHTVIGTTRKKKPRVLGSKCSALMFAIRKH